jgi:hypothetical protein
MGVADHAHRPGRQLMDNRAHECPSSRHRPGEPWTTSTGSAGLHRLAQRVDLAQSAAFAHPRRSDLEFPFDPAAIEGTAPWRLASRPIDPRARRSRFERPGLGGPAWPRTRLWPVTRAWAGDRARSLPIPSSNGRPSRRRHGVRCCPPTCRRCTSGRRRGAADGERFPPPSDWARAAAPAVDLERIRCHRGRRRRLLGWGD